MAKFTMRATGFRASVLLGAVVVIFLLATGSRFRRVCDRIDSYVDEVSTQITAREMRGMVGQIQGRTTDQLIADSSMARRVDALRVTVSGMTCADTFIFGVLCQVSYTLGTGPKGAGDRQGYVQLARSGRVVGLLPPLELARPLFVVSPRRCSMKA